MTLRVALVAAATVLTSVFVAGAALAAWPGPSRGDAAAPTLAAPSWFGPIWDHYDRNPAITPTFDFASLYSGRPEWILDGMRLRPLEKS